MSWGISLSGHSTNDEAELEKVNALFAGLAQTAKLLGLNPTTGATSGNSGERVKTRKYEDVT